MTQAWPPPVQAVQALPCVPDILSVMAEMTGLRFVCVAHVTPSSWTTCAVLDRLGFGLQPGDPLDVTTTLCDSVRKADAVIVIDHVSQDELFRDHPCPRQYGFESYISIPIYDTAGAFFGTLCGLDPKPLVLSESKTVKSLELFAQLISKQLEAERRHAERISELTDEKATALLREGFIAVLGHDIRTPLSSILHGAQILQQRGGDSTTLTVARTIQRSGQRIGRMIDDVLDFVRGRLGGGIALELEPVTDLAEALAQTVVECQSEYPQRAIVTDIAIPGTVWCNRDRMTQLLSNLLSNALRYGEPGTPVRVDAHVEDGTFRLTVINEGETIAPDKLGKLFQPYWRDDDGQPRRGLGLGLYIASEIAHAHGGKLHVVSRDRRTAFTCSAPAGLR
ncbi:GAF domain-containing sensor histidine kinase [Pseudoduganella albidiflava]|uniref:histidine kinase n=1 Tax=Pseudoduganella albidiflava TaxID=321983 RepID=A0A411WRV5_9BURK|nr:GAF domain-containing sensor histidine kinase [Pseudoduganella albidiflava]QBH99504.1 GAF domain-containing sensor histidine kinase [Pseudoduganella albidiflava]GGY45369.1 sensor histidine kinase [Pseudoduganella albidiflava]